MTRRAFVAIAVVLAAWILVATLRTTGRDGVEAIRRAPSIGPATGVDHRSLPAPGELGTTRGASPGPAGCPDRYRTGGLPAVTEQDLQRLLDDPAPLIRQLSASPAAEHLLLAALLQTDPAARAELLERLVSLAPDQAFVYWSALQICAGAGESAACFPGPWERRLVELDAQNSEVWMRLAAHRYAAGDPDAALDAVHRGATAAETRDYLPETIEMIERGLAAATDLSFRQRVETAWGIAASLSPVQGDPVRMCMVRGNRDANWARACLAYGELAERQGRTEMNIAMALAIQRHAHLALGAQQQAALAEQRLEARRQARGEWVSEHHAWVQNLVFSDPNLFSDYLAVLRTDGELEAQRRMTREFLRRAQVDPAFACRGS